MICNGGLVANATNAFNLVFVYGTLKRGLYNSKVIRGANYIGAAKTKPCLPLITDEYYVPFLLQAPGMGSQVSGELYAVDNEMLAKLDELEGVPKYYTREQIEIEDLTLCPHQRDTGLIHTAMTMKPWVYMMPNHRITEDLLGKPHLDVYSAENHFKHYIPRYMRDKSHVSLNLQGSTAPKMPSSMPAKMGGIPHIPHVSSTIAQAQ